MAKPRFNGPKGTRDLYPLEMARRRWLLERWRRVSIRHGFEEIDGPTFEPADLYAVKSGEGILNELFQAFSGKDPAEVERVQEEGRGPYALRPEFTPTLARMYAAQANSLPKPTKWFMTGPFFRAEKPQRGRLREFLQWNADVLGDDTSDADVAIIELIVSFLDQCGLTPHQVSIEINDRRFVDQCIAESGYPAAESGEHSAVLALLDRRSKMPDEAFREAASAIQFDVDKFNSVVEDLGKRQIAIYGEAMTLGELSSGGVTQEDDGNHLARVMRSADALGIQEWLNPSINIVRGLAYYTGTVFEVIAEGERAVAGGGRYDNLVELFGGPPTPAVGFGMGDVVLTNLLQDKGLMPSDKQLLEEIGARPDVFLITPNQDLDAELTTLLISLRREGLHARRTTKTTRNIGKLLKEADTIHARYAIILEAPGTCTLKDLDQNEEHKNVATADIADRCRPTA